MGSRQRSRCLTGFVTLWRTPTLGSVTFAGAPIALCISFAARLESFLYMLLCRLVPKRVNKKELHRLSTIDDLQQLLDKASDVGVSMEEIQQLKVRYCCMRVRSRSVHCSSPKCLRRTLSPAPMPYLARLMSLSLLTGASHQHNMPAFSVTIVMRHRRATSIEHQPCT